MTGIRRSTRAYEAWLAAQLRDAFDMSLLVGLAPSVAFGVITMLLATATEDFG